MRYGELHLAARETLERMGERVTPEHYALALNAVERAAAKRSAPTTLPQALKQLQEEITKLDRSLGPVREASPPTHEGLTAEVERELNRPEHRGKYYAMVDEGRNEVRVFAVPNPHATAIPKRK